MSLTDIVNATADLVGLDRPASITGSDGTTEREFVALANQTGDELMRRAEWPDLYQELAVAAAQSSIALPADFHRLIGGGAITEAVTGAFIRGAVSSDQWRLIKISASAKPHYFINAGTVEFYPDTTANGATVAYVSKAWVRPSAGADTTAFMADDDIPLFSEALVTKGMVWRWRRNKGLEYADHLAEFEADLVTELKAGKGLTV